MSDERLGTSGIVAPDKPFRPGGLTLRALVPNAITSAAMCCGLTGIRFAIEGNFEKSVIAVILAGVLDGVDGRVARLLKGQSKFGAELDSLADSLSFGMAPALILFLWSLNEAPRIGWFACLAFAISCALRLARFNSRIDAAEQPHKSAGFLTGVPAPVGAGLGFLPLYLWFVTGREEFRLPIVVGPWMVLIALLMISNTATLSWGSLRPRRSVRLELIALAGIVIAALLTEPWWTLIVICGFYLLTIPYGIVSYAKVKRHRAATVPPMPEPIGSGGGALH